MQLFDIEPKLGWKNATDDEMQKSCANDIAKKHCLNAKPIYDLFNELNIKIFSIMYYFIDKEQWLKNNDLLFRLLLDKNDENIKELFDLIGNKYKKIKE